MGSNARDGSIPFPGTSLRISLGLLHFMFSIYILYSKKFDRFYVGHCEDLIKRLERHNHKAVPSTKAYVPWVLVYTEKFQSRSSAAAREKEIKKKKSRKYIEFLINKIDL